METCQNHLRRVRTEMAAMAIWKKVTPGGEDLVASEVGGCLLRELFGFATDLFLVGLELLELFELRFARAGALRHEAAPPVS